VHRFGHAPYVTIAIMSVQRAARATALVLALVALSAAARNASGHATDLFDDLFQRGQKQNGQLRSLTATFTETTTSTLLTRPLVAHGTVAIERPGRVALKYAEPDQRIIVIDGDRMTFSWPARGLLQTKDIGATQRRVQKYFVDSSPAELREHFHVTAREADDRPGFLVTMVPTRKQIQAGLTRLELWIDPASLLLAAMRMTFPNGDTKLMTFSDVKANVPIDISMFKIPTMPR
jgi:outer membrane lipoprotein carrier protein